MCTLAYWTRFIVQCSQHMVKMRSIHWLLFGHIQNPSTCRAAWVWLTAVLLQFSAVTALWRSGELLRLNPELHSGDISLVKPGGNSAYGKPSKPSIVFQKGKMGLGIQAVQGTGISMCINKAMYFFYKQFCDTVQTTHFQEWLRIQKNIKTERCNNVNVCGEGQTLMNSKIFLRTCKRSLKLILEAFNFLWFKEKKSKILSKSSCNFCIQSVCCDYRSWIWPTWSKCLTMGCICSVLLLVASCSCFSWCWCRRERNYGFPMRVS